MLATAGAIILDKNVSVWINCVYLTNRFAAILSLNVATPQSAGRREQSHGLGPEA
jgi:hypothetical protein